MNSAGPRTLEEMLTVELPPDVWDGRDYTNIYCAVLFADLENSVQISRIISPADYDALIDKFQVAMLSAIELLRGKMNFPNLEVGLAGDQLVVFLYNEVAVKYNFLLDGPGKVEGEERKRVVRAYSKANEEVALNALRVAVYLKSAWLSNEVNIERITLHREPVGLALGVHADKVFLRNRADGKRRVEGYTVNLAKRVESFSRQGSFSRIMFSQAAANIIRGTVIKHSQLRQRIFFHRHVVDSDALKGIGRTEIYELKFFHRIGIPPAPVDLVELYVKILSHDPTNIWAYYQLSAHYALTKDYEHLERLARRTILVYPNDEKILHDLGLYYLGKDMLGLAASYFEQALKVNPELDISYEWLAKIYDQQKDKIGAAENARRALLLSPGSPMNQVNLALALIDIDELHEAAHHMANGVENFSEFLTEREAYSDVFRYLHKLAAAGSITPRLMQLIGQYAPAFLDEMRAEGLSLPE